MKVLTFGEVMLRLKTPEHLKILQADTFEANYGGAEAFGLKWMKTGIW